MIDIQVNIVQPQILQTGVDHLLDMLPAGDSVCDLIRSAGQKFGGYHHILPFCKVPKCPAQVLLTGAALVADRCIKKVDAQLQSPFDDFS